MIRARVQFAGEPPVVAEFPEGQDPFAICNAMAQRLGFTIDPTDAEHDAVMAARRKRMAAEAKVAAVGVRGTSRDAYARAKVAGKLTAQQSVIMDWLAGQSGDRTRQEIARGTGIGINAVAGRVKELLDGESLVETRKRTCGVTGETAWGVTIK